MMRNKTTGSMGGNRKIRIQEIQELEGEKNQQNHVQAHLKGEFVGVEGITFAPRYLRPRGQGGSPSAHIS